MSPGDKWAGPSLLPPPSVGPFLARAPHPGSHLFGPRDSQVALELYSRARVSSLAVLIMINAIQPGIPTSPVEACCHSAPVKIISSEGQKRLSSRRPRLVDRAIDRCSSLPDLEIIRLLNCRTLSREIRARLGAGSRLLKAPSGSSTAPFACQVGIQFHIMKLQLPLFDSS